ncbi:hypothetical protein GDO86_014600, partial [Hymenochirus boettgeri]
MESFLRDQLGCFKCLWDRIWPPQTPPDIHQIPTVGAFPPGSCGSTTDIVTALYDFQSRNPNELSIQMGEELWKIHDEGDYILARKLTGAMELGLVPSIYVAHSSLPSARYCAIKEPWYLEVENRNEAEKLLMDSPNVHGSFLVRPSESTPGQFSLSVRNMNAVSHFRIQKNSNGEFYIQGDRSFSTLQELIIFYKTNWKMIKTQLLQPCIQVVRQGDEWERPREEFTLLKKLGEGYFGEVWEGLWNNKDKVAIKTFKQAHINESDFEKEISTLKNLCHRNLIQLYAVCSLGEPVYIVTELMSKGSLREFLHGQEGKTLTVAQFLMIICQVADGMAYLENKHVVHRDLAARNVLVDDNLVCKIADFGLARLMKDDFYSLQNSRTIPIKWTAPEALTQGKYSTKSDVWSFGILMYEVFTFAEQPYTG